MGKTLIKKMNKKLLFASVFAFGFAVQAVGACTTISSLPATISSSGSYCLQDNLSYIQTGNAITINASNVELDFNGQTISGPHADGPTSNAGGYAVISGLSLNNIRIKNGTIKGFTHGISFGSFNSDTTVENMQIIDSVVIGIATGRGTGITVINNKIVMNANVYTGTYPNPTGITAGGNQLLIEGNDISFVVDHYDAQYTDLKGISISNANIGVISNNTIMGGNYYQLSLFYGSGIYLLRSDGMILEENKFSRLHTGIKFHFGAHHVYRNNTSTWVPTNNRYVILLSSATDGGGNI